MTSPSLPVYTSLEAAKDALAPYGQLSVAMRQQHSASTWHGIVCKHCVLLSKTYSCCPQFLQGVLTLKQYCSEVVRIGRESLLIYPYAMVKDIIVNTGKNPLHYYLDMLEDLLREARGYDTVPNFTAVDILRLLGIGRNQFLELRKKAGVSNATSSNTSATKKAKSAIASFFSRTSIRSYLPTTFLPDCNLEPFSQIMGTITELPEGAAITQLEKSVSIERLNSVMKQVYRHTSPHYKGKEGDNSDDSLGGAYACQYPFEEINSLFRGGYVVPMITVDEEDCFRVEKFDSFVMNTTTDHGIEALMYKVLVTMDERTPLALLAGMINIEVYELCEVVATLQRLKLVTPVARRWPRELRATTDSTPTDSSSRLDGEEGGGLSTPDLAIPATPVGSGGVGQLNNQTFPTKGGPHESWTGPIAEFLMNQQHQHQQAQQRSAGGGDSNSVEDAARKSLLAMDTTATSGGSRQKRIALLYTTSVTGYLMMHNAKAGHNNQSSLLKAHAVTLFEAGKMSHEQLHQSEDGLAQVLNNIGDEIVPTLLVPAVPFKGEASSALLTALKDEQDCAQVSGDKTRGTSSSSSTTILSSDSLLYFHCLHSIRSTLTELETLSIPPNTEKAVDLVKIDALNDLDANARYTVLCRNYAAFFVLHPTDPPPLLDENLSGIYGSCLTLASTPWLLLFLYESLGHGPPCALFAMGDRVRSIPAAFTQVVHPSAEVTIYSLGDDQRIQHCNPFHAIMPLNDLLVQSPAFVMQSHCLEEEDFLASDRILLKIPFSASDGEIKEAISNGISAVYQDMFKDYVRCSQEESPSSSSVVKEDQCTETAEEEEEEKITNNKNQQKNICVTVDEMSLDGARQTMRQAIAALGVEYSVGVFDLVISAVPFVVNDAATGEKEQEELRVEVEITERVITDVALGIPVDNLSACQLVLKHISQLVGDEDKMDLHTKSMASLGERLNNFVAKYSGEASTIGSSIATTTNASPMNPSRSRLTSSSIAAASQQGSISTATGSSDTGSNSVRTAAGKQHSFGRPTTAEGLSAASHDTIASTVSAAPKLSPSLLASGKTMKPTKDWHCRGRSRTHIPAPTCSLLFDGVEIHRLV